MKTIYDDELLKFLFQLEPENLQRSPAVGNKFAELLKKEEEKQTLLRTARILLKVTRCKAYILPTTITYLYGILSTKIPEAYGRVPSK